jgi:hypothetical protein
MTSSSGLWKESTHKEEEDEKKGEDKGKNKDKEEACRAIDE